MKPPMRWLDAASDAPQGARDLLASAPATPAFTDELRYRLALGVAKTASLPVAATWPALVAKGVAVAAIGGASGLIAHGLAGTPAAKLPPPDAAPVVAAHPAPHVAEPPPVSVDQLPQLQLPTAPPDRAPRLKVDPRLEEAELLEKARGLVGSQPAAALKLTSEHARQFPKGRLRAEADLIAAQALLGMGRVGPAKERARASLSRSPNGIYARQLREIIDAK